MKFEVLLVAILFTIPGSLAWEIANLFTPHKTKRSEKQFAINLLFFGCVCLAFVSALRRTSPHELVTSLSNPNLAEGWSIYGEASAAVIALSGFIILWRLVVYPQIERVVRKAFRYYGEVYVWECAVEELQKGRYVQVFTIDNWFFLGDLERSPTIINDRDIYINVKSFGKLDEQGDFIFRADEPPEDHTMFIPAEQVARIAVIAESENSFRPLDKVQAIRAAVNE